MNKLINQFNPSHFFRQLYCGAVFFLPLWLVKPEYINHFLGSPDWSPTKLIVVAVFASIIGTIIYHLEKNIWGYASYTMRKCFPEISFRITVIGMLLSILALLQYNHILPDTWKDLWSSIWTEQLLWEWALAFLILSLIGIIIVYVIFLCIHTYKNENTRINISAKAFGEVIDETQTIWKLKSEGNKQALWGHIKTWSDLIHCGYTTAFAYFAGSAIALISWTPDGSGTTNEKLFMTGLICSIFLVFFEFFCECHKQLHIDNMLEAEKENTKKEGDSL